MKLAPALHALLLLLATLLPTRPLAAADAAPVAGVPHYVWLEAELFAPLKGANFSYQQPAITARGSWGLSGPGVAPEWTQGGESEWMSIAARADETNAIAVKRACEIPAAGDYALWVRYADYRGKKEEFGVRVTQAGKSVERHFGREPRRDELDPMKLLWDWAFAWDSAAVTLAKGPATVEIFITGPSDARRQVDCVCLTTDKAYEPTGRIKPDFAAWRTLRALQSAQLSTLNSQPPPAPLHTAKVSTDLPKQWRIATNPPAFLWNVGAQWSGELAKPVAERINHPFSVDPPLLKDFLAAHRGKELPVYSHPLSGPVWHIPDYPTVFTNGSPFLTWLDANPTRRFSILLNYGEPKWPANADKAAVRANLRRYQHRFAGFIAGESVSYAYPKDSELNPRIQAARTRGDVLAALRDLYTVATVAKFTNYFGAPLTAEEAWAPVVSCLSANMEAYAHALCNWGVQRLGHENTGNGPTLARRLAFMRGAARQFGARLVNYQSCNLGDAATMFSRESFFYAASSRYVLDNQYDLWAGAGHHWLLKDYLLWYLAGVDAFYNEQGVDMYWKPGGNSAGDDFPVQLSPKGKTAEAVQRLAAAHPRGTQFTPIAFLLDEAHGWSQERFTPGGFQLDPELNPAVLRPGRHEAGVRGWFDVAYYPAPETQNEPASAIRQGFVNGIFGDVFDVIVTAPKRTQILATYPVVIAAGEVPLTTEWGKALNDYVRKGGTLVVCADQFTGPGVKELDLPALGAEREAAEFNWALTGETVAAQVFRHRELKAGKDRVLATTTDKAPLALARSLGAGQVIVVGAPLGLGLDERPVPVLALLLRHLAAGLTPVRVTGDMEWTLNKLDDGGWLVALFNNRGVIKPQHGMLPTDEREAQRVMLRVPFVVTKSTECMTAAEVRWQTAVK